MRCRRRNGAARLRFRDGEEISDSAFHDLTFLGGFSAHRFYLNTPLTAIAQVCLWYVSLMLFMAGNPGAFYSMTAGALWIVADAFLMPRLRDAATEKLRRRAEAVHPEPVSS